MAEARPVRSFLLSSTKPRGTKGANAEKGRPCWSARDDDWPARAWPAGLRASEPARPPPALGQFTADRVRSVHQKTVRASTSALWARYHGREVAGQSCSQHKKSCIQRHGLAR